MKFVLLFMFAFCVFCASSVKKRCRPSECDWDDTDGDTADEWNWADWEEWSSRERLWGLIGVDRNATRNPAMMSSPFSLHGSVREQRLRECHRCSSSAFQAEVEVVVVDSSSGGCSGGVAAPPKPRPPSYPPPSGLSRRLRSVADRLPRPAQDMQSEAAANTQPDAASATAALQAAFAVVNDLVVNASEAATVAVPKAKAAAYGNRLLRKKGCYQDLAKLK